MGTNPRCLDRDFLVDMACSGTVERYKSLHVSSQFMFLRPIQPHIRSISLLQKHIP